jgi:hypothetical protein
LRELIKFNHFLPITHYLLPTPSGLTHKTKETGFLAGDFADEIWISRSETRFGA